MNKRYTNRSMAIIACLVFSRLAFAQTDESAFNSLMLSNGKLYTVVGVILIIFVGIIIYLYNTDKKLESIENQIRSE